MDLKPYQPTCSISDTNWHDDKVSNAELVTKCNIRGIKSNTVSGHIIWMSDNRILKVLYSQIYDSA